MNIPYHKIKIVDKKLTTIFLVFLNYLHYYKAYEPKWGSNDISGFDLISSNYFGEYITVALFHSPFIAKIISFGTNFFLNASLELTYGLPLVIFSFYLIKEIRKQSCWSKVVLGAAILFLSGPFLIVVIHNLSSSIFSGFFSLLIFSNYFSEKNQISPTNFIIAFALMFLALNYRVGSELQLMLLVVLISVPLFIFLAGRSKGNVAHKVGGLFVFCSGVFTFFYCIKSVYFLPFYNNELGLNFFELNAYRHAVQFSITLPIETKIELLGLDHLNTPIFKTFPIPEALYTNEWFSNAFNILVGTEGLTTEKLYIDLMKSAGISGSDFIFWQVVISSLIFYLYREKNISTALLISALVPIAVLISVTLLSRSPPQRFWMPALMVGQIILLILSVELAKEYLIKKKGIHFSFGVSNYQRIKPEFITIRFSLISFLVIVNLIGTVNFVKSASDYHRKASSNKCDKSELYTMLAKENEKYISYPDVFSSICLIEPYKELSYPALDILLVGGTSFLTKTFQMEYYKKGGMIGHVCEEKRKLIFNERILESVQEHLGENITINEILFDKGDASTYFSGTCSSDNYVDRN